MLDSSGVVGAFVTIVGTIFVAELTDKDALLLLSLATKRSPWSTFAAGSCAFTITSAIIVLLGSALVTHVPIFWVKIAGGAIMLGYAVWEYVGGLRDDKGAESVEEERRLSRSAAKSGPYAFLAVVSSLIVLDLAGDATELVTIVFVAQFGNLLLVFAGAVVALVAASGLETILGNRLGRVLSARRVRYLSSIVFLSIGIITIASSFFES